MCIINNVRWLRFHLNEAREEFPIRDVMSKKDLKEMLSNRVINPPPARAWSSLYLSYDVSGRTIFITIADAMHADAGDRFWYKTDSSIVLYSLEEDYDHVVGYHSACVEELRKGKDLAQFEYIGCGRYSKADMQDQDHSPMCDILKDVSWAVFNSDSTDLFPIQKEMSRNELILKLRSGYITAPGAQRGTAVSLFYACGSQHVYITLNNCKSVDEDEWIVCDPSQCVFIESIHNNVDYVFEYYDEKLRVGGLMPSQEMFIVHKRANRMGKALSEEELHKEAEALCNSGNERHNTGGRASGVMSHLRDAAGSKKVLTRVNNTKVGDRFLDPLIKKLCIENITSKRILAALVMGTLRNNKCGLTPENEPEVKKRLMEGILTEYEFSVFDLAGYWGNDLLALLMNHEEGLKGFDPDRFYTDYVWPYLRENEIVPGVRMTD